MSVFWQDVFRNRSYASFGEIYNVLVSYLSWQQHDLFELGLRILCRKFSFHSFFCKFN